MIGSRCPHSCSVDSARGHTHTYEYILNLHKHTPLCDTLLTPLELQHYILGVSFPTQEEGFLTPFRRGTEALLALGQSWGNENGHYRKHVKI